jgi:hypothetical protein
MLGWHKFCGGTIGVLATGNEVLGADAGTTVFAGLGQVGDLALGVLLTCAGASGFSTGAATDGLDVSMLFSWKQHVHAQVL